MTGTLVEYLLMQFYFIIYSLDGTLYDFTINICFSLTQIKYIEKNKNIL